MSPMILILNYLFFIRIFKKPRSRSYRRSGREYFFKLSFIETISKNSSRVFETWYSSYRECDLDPFLLGFGMNSIGSDESTFLSLMIIVVIYFTIQLSYKRTKMIINFINFIYYHGYIIHLK